MLYEGGINLWQIEPQGGDKQRVTALCKAKLPFLANTWTRLECEITPEGIVARAGDPVAEDEGCLSIPGISVPIARPPFARCRYYDLDGQLWEIEGDGLLGRCLQHETDHLDGVTMFERAEPMARLKALEDYERALAAGARPGEISVEA